MIKIYIFPIHLDTVFSIEFEHHFFKHSSRKRVMNLHVDTLNIAYFTVINVKVSFRIEYVDRPGLVEKTLQLRSCWILLAYVLGYLWNNVYRIKQKSNDE